MDDSLLKKGLNPDKTGLVISQAAEIIKKITYDWSKSDERPVVLFRALLSLAEGDPDKANSGFTVLELVEKVRQQEIPDWGRQNKRPTDQEDEDTLRKLVRRNWKKLEAIWSLKERGLAERFAAAGFETIPEIGSKPGGGQANYAKYWFSIKPRPEKDTDSINSQTKEVEKGEIRYFTDDFGKAPVLGWLGRSGFPLVGWRRGLFLTLLLIELIYIGVGVLVVWLALRQANDLSAVISALGVALIVAVTGLMTIRPFLKLADDRIIVAPTWIQGWNGYEDRLLELRRSDELEANVIYLSRYTATCPHCGGDIRIRHGGREFFGRLIGGCSKNPVEHVFSFDNILLKGKSLRN